MYITEKKLLKWSLYSNILYIFFYLLFRPQGINAAKIVITSLLLFSVISLIILSVKNWFKLIELSKISRFIFKALIFWGVIVVLRGFSFSLQDWVTNFGNVQMGIAWLVPLSLVLGIKIENWTVIFKAIFFMFHLMFLLFFISLFYNDNYTDWVWLMRPVNFILLIGLYHFRFINKIKIYLIVVIYIISVAIYTSRRIDLLFLVMTFCFLVLDKLFTIRVKKRFLKYIFGGFILIFTLIFTVGYEFLSNIISSVIDFQETRIFLFTELFEELSKTNEKFIGRGSLGTYYSEFFEGTRRYWEYMGNTGWKGDSSTRIGIEVGYLQMLLKGGFVLLILNVSISICAIYVALFKSNNKFVKRLGYFILIISILSLVEFPPKFTIVYIIYWMAIGTVLCKKYRMLSDTKIDKLIQF